LKFETYETRRSKIFVACKIIAINGIAPTARIIPAATRNQYERFCQTFSSCDKSGGTDAKTGNPV
jgi:hypothetical protein